MKTILVIILLLSATIILSAQTTHFIEENGFSYSPATLNAKVGDSVKFNGTGSHPVLQVNEVTWNNNETTPLSGGFSFSQGTGKLKLTEEGTIYYVCTSHVASNGMKGKIVISVVTGIDDFADSKFSVYPVPLLGNELTIALKSLEQEPISVDIYDLAGRLVITSKGTATDGKYLIDCEDLKDGVFVMKIYTGGETYYSKFSR